ncbi:type II toxin-antitoxin system VapC family toxin [Treponema sp.]|uniref:type II toxin-antitoxin system VapC family toxin n=1 Tax=Treponema sp. TaxID=166 RepID=UPI00388D855B
MKAESEFVTVNSCGEIESSFPAAVVDTSFLAGAILSDVVGDESKEAAEFIEDLISKNGQLVVPQLFWFEIGNVFLNAVKPKKDGRESRISKMQLLKIEQLLTDLPIYTDLQPDSETRMRIREIAMEFDLSYYDASYLELAQRKGLQLKTFDRQLLQAISRCGSL